MKGKETTEHLYKTNMRLIITEIESIRVYHSYHSYHLTPKQTPPNMSQTILSPHVHDHYVYQC